MACKLFTMTGKLFTLKGKPFTIAGKFFPSKKIYFKIQESGNLPLFNETHLKQPGVKIEAVLIFK